VNSASVNPAEVVVAGDRDSAGVANRAWLMRLASALADVPCPHDKLAMTARGITKPKKFRVVRSLVMSAVPMMF